MRRIFSILIVALVITSGCLNQTEENMVEIPVENPDGEDVNSIEAKSQVEGLNIISKGIGWAESAPEQSFTRINMTSNESFGPVTVKSKFIYDEPKYVDSVVPLDEIENATMQEGDLIYKFKSKNINISPIKELKYDAPPIGVADRMQIKIFEKGNF
jgi:hypothetical protein